VLDDIAGVEASLGWHEGPKDTYLDITNVPVQHARKALKALVSVLK
jgi:hypothetical protein